MNTERELLLPRVNDMPEYWVWIGMRRRCTSSLPKSKAYYLERGITVCDRWQKSFQNFVNDMGLRPSSSHSLDRIDGDKGYSPENCRWATIKQQARNKASNRRISIDGRTMCVSDWADESGINLRTIIHRLNRGWENKSAVFQPTK